MMDVSEKLLRLAALELAHARTKDHIPQNNGEKIQVDFLNRTIEQLQNELGLLPVQIQARSLGVNVMFFYHGMNGMPLEPSPQVKIELESEVWRDPKMAEPVSKVPGEKRLTGTIVITRNQLLTSLGQSSLKTEHFSSPVYREQ